MGERKRKILIFYGVFSFWFSFLSVSPLRFLVEAFYRKSGEAFGEKVRRGGKLVENMYGMKRD